MTTESTTDVLGVASSALFGLRPYHEEAAVTIYHGDSAQILPMLGRFDLLLTDPKYGIGADTHAGQRKNGWKQYGSDGWDNERTPRWLLEMALAKCGEAIVWGGNYFTDCLPPRMGWLVWNKMQRDFSLADGELAWSSYDKALRIADISRGKALTDGKEHPTQKSLALASVRNIDLVFISDRRDKTPAGDDDWSTYDEHPSYLIKLAKAIREIDTAKSSSS